MAMGDPNLLVREAKEDSSREKGDLQEARHFGETVIPATNLGTGLLSALGSKRCPRRQYQLWGAFG